MKSGLTKLCRFRTLAAIDIVDSTSREGACGAAFVEGASGEGGVAEIFQSGTAGYTLSLCLDDLVESFVELCLSCTEAVAQKPARPHRCSTAILYADV